MFLHNCQGWGCGKANLITTSFTSLIARTNHQFSAHPIMVVNPLLDDCITGLPIDHSLETRWLRASHNTHQNQTRMGLHEEIPCLQQEVNQDTSGVPLYLKRKLLLMHHDG